MGGRLTGKQRAFIDKWFECKFNGTEAARQAGYQGSDTTLANVASENLRKPKILTRIAERWAAHGMTADEVAGRLTEQARADISEFVTETGAIDWKKVRSRGHLVKKIVHRKGQQSQIELYDAQAALVQLGRTLSMFTDKQNVDITTKGESLKDRYISDEQHERALEALYEALRLELHPEDTPGARNLGAGKSSADIGTPKPSG